MENRPFLLSADVKGLPRSFNNIREKFTFKLPDCPSSLIPNRLDLAFLTCLFWRPGLLSVPLHHFVSGQRVVLR